MICTKDELIEVRNLVVKSIEATTIILQRVEDYRIYVFAKREYDWDGPDFDLNDATICLTYALVVLENASKKLAGDVLGALSDRDDTIEFGDHSANRVQPITANFLGVAEFDAAVLKLGGSGAVDNILFDSTRPIPEPAAGSLLGLGLVGLAARQRLRLRKH